VLDLYPAPATATNAKSSAGGEPPPQPSRVEPPPPQPPPVTKKDLVIVIDPGHGGKDPGALGRKGTREKDVVLTIANHLRDLLTQEGSTKVLMTRETDVFVELEDRAKFANTHKADLFVSIHINSHPQTSVKGMELYHFGEASDPRALAVAARENGTPLEKDAAPWQFILADKLNDKKIDDSRELAWTTKKSLVKFMNSYYKINDHGVKTAPFFVLRMTTMPAILAEIAFISNPTEEKLLQSPTYQKRMAEGIFNGLQSYITPLQTASR
ncbi:MAG: N-acetylmuramoyl-L-alanine amidase, partial [Nitrospirota bacterium]|nr:N-acetylmuramoyl-L-alanine amidase [Nitrospirota bacterium]